MYVQHRLLLAILGGYAIFLWLPYGTWHMSYFCTVRLMKFKATTTVALYYTSSRMADDVVTIRCGICLDECHCTVSTPCGHNFCRACLASWIRACIVAGGGPTCPSRCGPIPDSLEINKELVELVRTIQTLRASAVVRPPPEAVPFTTPVLAFVTACLFSIRGAAMARARNVVNIFGSLFAVVGAAFGAVCVCAAGAVFGGAARVRTAAYICVRSATSVCDRPRAAAAATARFSAAAFGNCLAAARPPRPRGGPGGVRRRPQRSRSWLLVFAHLVLAAAIAVWWYAPSHTDPHVTMLRGVGSDAHAAIVAYKRLQVVGALPVAMQSFARYGGIPIVIAHLARFAADAEVVERACGALANAAAYDSLPAAVVKEGGVGAILTSLENHPNVVGIVLRGCEALSNIIANSHALVPAVSPAVPLLVTLLQRYSASPDVALRLSTVLKNLVMYSAPSSEALIAADGISVLVSTMRLHKGDAELLRRLCILMGYVAAQGGVGQLVAAGAPAAVAEALRAHGSDSTFVRDACLFYANTATQDVGVKAIVRADGIELLLAALGDHAKNRDIVSDACTALQNMIMVDHSLRVNIVGAGGVALLRATVRGASPSAEVPQACRKVYSLMPYARDAM